MFFFSFKKQGSPGYTLIELSVVLAIIIVLTSAVLIGYRYGGTSLALSRSVHKLRQDIRRTQEMSMSSRVVEGAMPAGYGIHFDTNNPSSYIIFADSNGDNQYSGESEDIEVIEMEERISIDQLTPLGSTLTIVFSPPIPSVLINNSPAEDYAEITLTNGRRTASVKVNKVGLIEVISD